MTGREAYTMFTRAMGNDPHYYGKPNTQFKDHVYVAYDFLGSDEKRAWKRVADQIETRIARSKAASR